MWTWTSGNKSGMYTFQSDGKIGTGSDIVWYHTLGTWTLHGNVLHYCLSAPTTVKCDTFTINSMSSTKDSFSAVDSLGHIFSFYKTGW